MTELFHIVTKNLRLENVISQVKAINKYPCVVHIYDRVFKLDTKDEAWAIATGLEVGWYLSEESREKDEAVSH